MSGETLNYTFRWVGDYQIGLTVTDAAGNENSTQLTAVVKDTSHRDRPPIWVYAIIIAVICVVIIVVVVVIFKVTRKG
jgi:t-SNARE complex subunit (syntaxin)